MYVLKNECILFYKDQDEVVLWMNTVGPYHNRQETYGYFTLPFCHGPKESIGKLFFLVPPLIQFVYLRLKFWKVCRYIPI